jgi:hypothetical protein
MNAESGIYDRGRDRIKNVIVTGDMSCS